MSLSVRERLVPLQKGYILSLTFKRRKSYLNANIKDDIHGLELDCKLFISRCCDRGELNHVCLKITFFL